MAKDVILGFLRHILTFGGGYLVTKGVTDAANLELAVGAVTTLVGVVWSAVQKKQAA